ncbi:ribosomal biogenesis GTPase [Metamycoplasma cloacale]|uniref:Ribosome biogenesis GTPase A n=1 Tax=Metamycoplasma cloacale TaxID=92401 RepID=A0A2Z4LM25_9BACT|nr:ribosome biogenesis GTPase YlqF [Metamycoplasma cloacale]AWX42789.1 ribosome biogenesis GTPase YlqF [Metamycoplasma cloacale]VEU79393.1 ribosomal biogenesis GTPase [Metamycoplasma cloacale]
MIHWFPGHMAKEFKNLEKKQKLYDVFIIVLDSRIPISSFNNEIYKIANNKPILFILNKSDKTDINKIQKYISEYQTKGKVILTNLKSNQAYKQINSALNNFYNEFKKKNDAKGKLTPALKCIVVGVPNVGKSTLINLLAKSKVTKVGATAGVTRAEQWINCKNYMLLDTPGLLMPKISSDEVGAKLAIVGSIRLEALNQNELIVALYQLISKTYPSKLIDINLTPTLNEDEIFANIEQYAKNNNWLLKNEVYDTNKAINQLINYFKNLDSIIYD